MADPEADPTPAPSCPACGSHELYMSTKPITAGGGYAPDLLPGLHPWYSSGRLHAVVCAACGLYRQYADRNARQRLPSSPKWRRL